jgi:hypothetical protein
MSKADDDDPLLGCRLKLQQAWRHRQSLGLAIETEYRPEEPPPLHFGVIVGDYLHNLRCVLDHVIWQLVLLNGRNPTYRNAFPICDTREDFEKATKRELRRLADDQLELVAAFQPYHLDGDPKEHSLAVLRDLSNIDKHRFVHPVVAVPTAEGEPVLLFTDLGVTVEALWRLEVYITYGLYKRFEALFPLPPHAVADR